MLWYSPLSAYFDDVTPKQPALSNDGKQRQPALGDFTSPIVFPAVHLGPPPSRACDNCLAWSDLSRAVDSLCPRTRSRQKQTSHSLVSSDDAAQHIIRKAHMHIPTLSRLRFCFRQN
jgi:hypothetical protein